MKYRSEIKHSCTFLVPCRCLLPLFIFELLRIWQSQLVLVRFCVGLIGAEPVFTIYYSKGTLPMTSSSSYNKHCISSFFLQRRERSRLGHTRA